MNHTFETFCAWVAGIYEGEGCVQIWTNKKKNTYILRASVANTEMDILQPIKDTFGGCISSNRKGVNKTCYVWMADGPTAEKFFAAIFPHTRCNRRRISIKLALKFQAMKHDPLRFEPRPIIGGRQITSAFRNEEIAIRNRLKAINGYKRSMPEAPADKGVS